ncbi:MAG: hypothetical protein P8X74_07355 [Reinekea sp.]|jgi:hypothetical protein
MAEFLLIFIVTLIFILFVTAALIFGRAPVYRPDSDHIQSILTRMLEGVLPEAEWDFFIEMPIRHDAKLDYLRTVCLETYEQHAIRTRDGCVRMREEGLIRIRYLLNRLEAEGSKTF